MSFPHTIFKPYDIRGIVDVTLTPTIAEQIGRAFATTAQARGQSRVVVGWDGRASGPRLAAALSDGLRASGCDVIEIGQVPTPTLYYATVALQTGTGVQVTGSHNPPEYNGMKMMIGGDTLADTAIQQLKQCVLAGDFARGQGTLTRTLILPDYIAAIGADIRVARPLKLVIDCGNGVAGGCAPQIFRQLGCEVHELFCEVDGTFPNHHPDPSQPENLTDLIAAVQQTQADVGLAFDGDGDRLGVVASDGTIIWPDRLLGLFARALLSQHANAEIIFDVKCSKTLPDLITHYGGRATMSKTGHSFIKSKLKETAALLAGEMSGHIFFNDRWGGFDDGIYAGARLCELLSHHPDTPAAVFAALPNTVNTPELRIDMPEGEHYRIVAALVAAADFPDGNLTTIDGLRVDFPTGFGLIRASNTTPAIIMRFEANTHLQLTTLQTRFKTLIQTIAPDLVLPF